MKIACFDVGDEERELFAPLLAGLDVTFNAGPLSLATIDQARDADVVSVFVSSAVTKEIIDQLPNAKLIATCSTGYDHIDVAYARTKGVAVATVPSYGAHTVAEYVFALLLALARKIMLATRGYWENDTLSHRDLMGFELRGKTLGIVGLGRIGKEVARIARGFSMHILAFDSTVDEPLKKELSIEYVDLSTLLGRSDIITVHVPYMPQTHHIINKQNISLIKNGAVLINTARGEVVETEALVEALQNGKIAHVGLDVLEGERYMKDEVAFLTDNVEQAMETKEGFKTLLEAHALTRDKRVIATPHIAYMTSEAVHEIYKTTAENIRAFIAEKPQNIVAL